MTFRPFAVFRVKLPRSFTLNRKNDAADKATNVIDERTANTNSNPPH